MQSIINNEDDLRYFCENLGLEHLNTVCQPGANDAAVDNILELYNPQIDATFAAIYCDSQGIEDVGHETYDELRAYCVWLMCWNVLESAEG